MQWSKDLESAGGVPNCTGSAGCFSWLWAPTKYKFRLRSLKPSESQRSRSRFHWRNAPKQPTQNTVAKKRAHHEDVMDVLHCGEESVLVAIEEIKPHSPLTTMAVNSRQTIPACPLSFEFPGAHGLVQLGPAAARGRCSISTSPLVFPRSRHSRAASTPRGCADNSVDFHLKPSAR